MNIIYFIFKKVFYLTFYNNLFNNTFSFLENLEFINIAGNFISDLKDIFILEKIKSLKKLYFLINSIFI